MNDLLFPFSQYWWVYVGFLSFVGLMLILDLGVFHRKIHAVSFKEASLWSLFWISLSLLLNFAFYKFAQYRFSTDPAYAAIPGFNAQAEASQAGLEFLTGFLIEKALAIDNIFVFVMVFSAFKIPSIYQHRVLFLGILGAVFFRGIFIGLGSHLMNYQWLVLIFGAFLILTGLKMMWSSNDSKDISQGWPMRILRRVLPVSSEFNGHKLFVKKSGLRYATPLLVALIVIELTDIVFALDSVPAIFAVTQEPLIVFVSNILAILGLRSLYFMLAGVMDRFVYLKYGLASVLVFVGLKMTWLNEIYHGKFPISWSLGIIGSLILGSIGVSLFATSKKSREKRGMRLKSRIHSPIHQKGASL